MMIGNDFKTFWWHIPRQDLPEGLTNVKVVSLDYHKVPQLFEAMNDGFQPISHTVTPRDEGVLMSILLVRAIDAPDNANALPLNTA